MRVRGDTPGDDARSAHYRAPEIVAAEQRILTFADGLLTWMRREEFPADYQNKLEGFFTHTTQRNPGLEQIEDGGDISYGVTSHWILEKLDPDANRLLMDLLRAAWERRCWREREGEISLKERDAL